MRDVRNLAEQPEQRNRHPDAPGITQCAACLALCVDLQRAFGAHRQVVRRSQMRAHPELAIHERGYRLSGQMLGRSELARSTHRRLALRGEWGRQPGERRETRERSPERAAIHHGDAPFGPVGPADSCRPNSKIARECTHCVPTCTNGVARYSAAASADVEECAARYSRMAWRPRWMRLRTVPSFTSRVAPISS